MSEAEDQELRRAEQVLAAKDPLKALDEFRRLDVDEKLVTVFADGAMLRYEVRLVEAVVGEIRRWGRRTVTIMALALAVLIGLAVGNRSIATSIKDCTTPGTACTTRAQAGGQCVVIALENDNRLVHSVDTIPVPKECAP